MFKTHHFVPLFMSAIAIPLTAIESKAAILTPIDPLTAAQSASRTALTAGVANAPNVTLTDTIFGPSVLRRLRLQTTQSNGNNATASIPISPTPGDNGLSLSAAVGVNALAIVSYGNGSGTPLLPSLVNFTTPVGGFTPDRIQFNEVFFDLAGGSISLTLASGTGTNRRIATVTKNVTTIGAEHRIDFLYSEFVGVNMTAINGFVYTLDPSLNGDASFKINGLGDARPDVVESVPEPANLLGLFAMSLAGGVSLIRKRKR